MRINDASQAERLIIIGLGTIGSVIFEALVRALIDQPKPVVITIIDNDTIQAHNLAKSCIYTRADLDQTKVHSAKRWAARVNGDLAIVALPLPVREVGQGIFHGVDTAVITVDNYQARMEASRGAWRAGVPRILTGGLLPKSTAGRYQRFINGPGPCVECGWGQEAYAFRSHPFPCSRPDHRGPQTSFAAALRVGSMIVEEVLAQIAGAPAGEPVEVRIDPSSYGIRHLYPRRNPACRFDHQHRSPVIPLPQEAGDLTLGEAFTLAQAHLKTRQVTLQLSEPVATNYCCANGHAWPKLQRLAANGLSPKITCSQCGQPGAATEMTWFISTTAAATDNTLMEKLVPPGDVLSFFHGEKGLHKDRVHRERVHLKLTPPARWQAEPKKMVVSQDEST
jgi:hypothetical protein